MVAAIVSSSARALPGRSIKKGGEKIKKNPQKKEYNKKNQKKEDNQKDQKKEDNQKDQKKEDNQKDQKHKKKMENPKKGGGVVGCPFFDRAFRIRPSRSIQCIDQATRHREPERISLYATRNGGTIRTTELIIKLLRTKLQFARPDPIT
jgi:hypothetical protein